MKGEAYCAPVCGGDHDLTSRKHSKPTTLRSLFAPAFILTSRRTYHVLHHHFPHLPDQPQHLVEKNVLNSANGCAWTVVDDQQVLTTGDNRNSGVLRFKYDNVYLICRPQRSQLHAPRRCIHPLRPKVLTLLRLHSDYYTEDNYRTTIREKQLSNFHVTSPEGRNIKVNSVVAESRSLDCVAIITLARQLVALIHIALSM